MDDAALVSAARSGDREAWAVIYDRYADRLHDHCWSILRDEHEAADALHDAFVNAARALPQLRDPSRLRPWLYAIARNEAFRRHRLRARVVPTDDLGELGTVTVGLDAGGGAGAPVDELRTLVWDAAGGLSEDDKALLDLHLRQGFEGEALAEAMGITPNNAYVKLSRLRDMMERSLGALLVARTGRSDCPDLAALLEEWDGQLSPLLRKRIARHIDGCEVCEDRKRAMVSPLALLAGVPLLPAPAALRDRIVDDAVAASVTAPPVPADADDLFPPPPTPPYGTAAVSRSRWGWWLLGAAAAAAVLVFAVLLAIGGGGDGDEVSAESTTTTTAAETTTTSTSSTSTSTTSSTTSTTTSTTSTTAPPAPPAVTLSTTAIDLGASRNAGSFVITNTGGSAISFTNTTSNFALVRVDPITGSLDPGGQIRVTVTFDRANAPEGDFTHQITVAAGEAGQHTVAVTGTVTPEPPVITSVTSSETELKASPCSTGPTTTEITATFSDESDLSSAVLHWDLAAGPSGEADMTVDGTTATGTLGPFATFDTVEYWVVLTDIHGESAESQPHQSITVTPCSAP